jgi:hypothetical protein
MSEVVTDDLSLDTETKEFFDNGGDKVEEPKKEEVKQEVKSEPVKESKKDAPEDELKHIKAALSEERETRKRESEERRKESDERKKLEERFNKFLELASKAEEPKAPEKDKDPLGYLDHKADSTTKELQDLKQWRDNEEKTRSANEQFGRFVSTVQAKTAEFMQKAPDYAQAFEYVKTMEQKRLEVIGLPPEQVAANLSQWEINFANAALKMGKNPAEILYQQAQVLGYKAAQKEEEPAKKLETLAKGQEAARGLSSGEAPSELSLSKILQMNEDEMNELVSSKKGWSQAAKLFR